MHSLNMQVVFRWNPAAQRHFGAQFTWHPGDVSSHWLPQLAATVRETNLAYSGCLSCQVGGEAVLARDKFCLTTCHFLCWEVKTTFSMLIFWTVHITCKEKLKFNHCLIMAGEGKHATTKQSDNNQTDAGDRTSMPCLIHVFSGLLNCHDNWSLFTVCCQALALVLTLQST